MEETKQVSKVKFPITAINKVLEYLGTRPYLEVAELIKLVQESAEIEKDLKAE